LAKLNIEGNQLCEIDSA